VNLLALAAAAPAAKVATATAAAAEASGLSINFFWVIVAGLNFLLFLAIIWRFGFDPIANILAQRKARIDQGLADAEQARKDRDAGVAERDRVVAEARREANALIATAQKSAQELRDADIAATREELARLHERATADIQAERDRALADLRAQVADLALAAAGKLVGESMTDARQRRLVDEYLHEQAATGEGRTN
jgi:F-type H+-transporting ATPase subunit b